MTSFSELAAQQERDNEELRKQISRQEEHLDRLEGMISRNWIPLFGNVWDQLEGPSLDQLKEASKRNRELMALNVHIANGLNVINSYVWDGGIHYAGVPGKRQGRGTNVQALIDNPANRENYFSSTARKERQAAFYCDGMALYAGDNSDFSIAAIPIGEITDDMRNPNKSDEIWAWRRTWTEYKPGEDKAGESRSEWIYSNTFYDRRKNRKTVSYKGKSEPVADKRMFVKRVGRVPGWAYGVAEVQAAAPWAEEYRKAVAAGIDMTESMSKIFAQVKHNTQAGATAAAATIGAARANGGMAHIGANQDISVLSSAGAAYDFAKLFPILANFAAGIGVSAIALSANPGNAGGSYGAAKSLDRPEQLSTQARREINVDLDREVLIWMGVPEADLDVWFDPIVDEAELYRAEQRVELRLGTGLYEGEDIKRMHAELDGRDPNKVGSVPEGWLIPNNKESLELKSIDTDGTAAAAASNGGGFAPTQGSGAKTVKSGSGDQSADDIRQREGFGAILAQMQNEEGLDLIRELLVELRNRS